MGMGELARGKGELIVWLMISTSISQVHVPQKALLGTVVPTSIVTSCGLGQNICFEETLIEAKENVQEKVVVRDPATSWHRPDQPEKSARLRWLRGGSLEIV